MSELSEADKLKIRFAYLCSTYEPHDDCKDSKFECDFRAPGDESSDQCPCTFVREFKFLMESAGEG